MALAVASPQAPSVLAGRYQLLAKIGEGGMGTVWRAFDLDLEEPVAIKFLRDELVNDATLRTAFRREVKLARRVTHPNVARVFEFGQLGELYFLTMEFIDGETLTSRLQRDGALTHHQTLALGVSLCRGLAAAHAVSVVHGDIKPGNILLAPGRGAVLTDFGIAHGLADAASSNARMVGTPNYMSPELFDGADRSMRSDVYAVGVALFEALTGKSLWPIEALTTLVEHKRTRHEPVLTNVLGPGWIELITDCLHTDPQFRPADARALLARLAGISGFQAGSRRAAWDRTGGDDRQTTDAAFHGENETRR